MNPKLIDFIPNLDVRFIGPPLEDGPLPSFFYFSLSAEESLCLDPFNQPIKHLQHLPLRIFSISIPGHENDMPKEDAIKFWAEQIAKGHDIITEFGSKVVLALEELLERNILQTGKIAFGGLSRGVFIACHIAAKCSLVNILVGFAPLTDLQFSTEFQNLHLEKNSLANSLNLIHLSSKLAPLAIRFYIGNRDIRVNNKACYDLLCKIADEAYLQHLRLSRHEFISTTSLGFQGHGTSPEVFKQGAQWIKELLMN